MMLVMARVVLGTMGDHYGVGGARDSAICAHDGAIGAHDGARNAHDGTYVAYGSMYCALAGARIARDGV